MEGEVVTMQEIFRFRRTGADGQGKVLGRFEATGIRPRFAERLSAYGIHLPAELFATGRARTSRMDANALLMLYVALFVGVLLLVEGAYQLASNARRKSGDTAVNRRLHMLASGADPEQVLSLLRRPTASGALAQLPLVNRLPLLLVQAASSWSPAALLAGMAGLTLIAVLALGLLLPLPLAVLLGGALGVLIPLQLLRAQRRRRIEHLRRQLPDALDLIVRSLRAGHPLNAALGAVAREMPDPIGSEAGIAADEIAYGSALTEAVASMGARIGLEDLHYVVVAIKIQHGTGGNLANILAALAKVIRARFAMQRKISAISAEGRISGLFLSCTPPAIAGFISLVAPSYFGAVLHDPLFVPMVGLVGIMTLLNLLVLRRLVRFRF